MGTNVMVIITDNKVYSTYVETICFTAEYSNDLEKEQAIDTAKLTAFNYALSFGSVFVSLVHLAGNLTDNDIFKYLKR